MATTKGTLSQKREEQVNASPGIHTGPAHRGSRREDTKMDLQHLLVLCCYGGQPFIDFHLAPAHSSTQQIDPTDWQASDIAGSLLDNSSMPLIPHLREVLDVGVTLAECDLFNVTFTTSADQALFARYQAKLACRSVFDTILSYFK
ncbi:unnamed protein product [Nippostrongylus brasiliensis]|uniref:Uncharacterized protein n=1 Tax=Nippostrongylus brasiliensis TaxID=27835 RepID=A0A0N4XXU5_NIPBR|nr:unnamed protein product [Nippostrongylus brasiliensis]